MVEVSDFETLTGKRFCPELYSVCDRQAAYEAWLLDVEPELQVLRAARVEELRKAEEYKAQVAAFWEARRVVRLEKSRAYYRRRKARFAAFAAEFGYGPIE